MVIGTFGGRLSDLLRDPDAARLITSVASQIEKGRPGRKHGRSTSNIGDIGGTREHGRSVPLPDLHGHKGVRAKSVVG